MKKILIVTIIAMVFLSGCADKPSKIEKVSPCACYDFIQVG
ncbi:MULTISPECIES: hypothetical protein [Campylobacter]|uniref:Lipoprotein n=1 Tax=Campylobacter hyointestinalis subsp. hyointestinalis TaxID=91352 RepID=A0A9W5ANG2_CAMHY|nr:MULTISPECIES: hypothetical protein [Campylobacter]EGU24794.1 Hypothetical protein CFV354_1898 [Campylobacter fetus subsp. venerealis NCTC 10354]CDF65815.1 hypothetical protein CSG_19040 [Campylobacter fetus subsp. venerealis str. 84-112]CUU74944.1 Uncharacterised protein [Campylobacter hyointestinalis subsp. hyointestinalis]CUU76815.1 Uncharacterised protein [Campylobacter hyointestinalis]CUU90206.1 Uncharacterised protein [Campylobacter hyointestinalis subsp. hyointestinalis]